MLIVNNYNVQNNNVDRENNINFFKIIKLENKSSLKLSNNTWINIIIERHSFKRQKYHNRATEKEKKNTNDGNIDSHVWPYFIPTLT